MITKFRVISEFIEFIRANKKWWISPIVAFLFLLSGLIILTESAAVAPLIYSLF